MVSAILKMNEARLLKYTRFSMADKLQISYGVNHLKVNADASVVGELIEDEKGPKNRKEGKYKAGDCLELNLGRVSPQRYEMIIQPNLELYAYAYVDCPHMIGANTDSPLIIKLRFVRDCHLPKAVDHLFSCYLID